MADSASTRTMRFEGAEVPVGAVSASESYDVSVECGGAYTVTVTGAATGLSSPAGTLPASCASQSSPLVFDGDGVRRDTVSIGGTAGYGTYSGYVQYSVSSTWKGARGTA